MNNEQNDEQVTFTQQDRDNIQEILDTVRMVSEFVQDFDPQALLSQVMGQQSGPMGMILGSLIKGK